MRSYNEDPKHQRLGQFFMNALGEYNIDLYRSVPEDVDCFYIEARFWEFTTWLQTNWIDTAF
jgi:hypothetical protein